MEPTHMGYHHPLSLLWQHSSRVSEDNLHHRCFRLPFRTLAILPDNTRLTAPGFLLGTIVETSRDRLVDMDSKDPRPGLPLSVLALYQAFAEKSSVSLADFMQALAAFENENYDRDRILKVASHLFHPNIERTKLDRTTEKNMIVFRSRIISRQSKWTIFVTKDGCIGSTYHPDLVNGVRPGNLVVGLFGINLPFILSPAGHDTYRMINIARVVGHKWGHDFLRIKANGYTFVKELPFSKVEDYARFGMKEYIIII